MPVCRGPTRAPIAGRARCTTNRRRNLVRGDSLWATAHKGRRAESTSHRGMPSSAVRRSPETDFESVAIASAGTGLRMSIGFIAVLSVAAVIRWQVPGAQLRAAVTPSTASLSPIDAWCAASMPSTPTRSLGRQVSPAASGIAGVRRKVALGPSPRIARSFSAHGCSRPRRHGPRVIDTISDRHYYL